MPINWLKGQIKKFQETHQPRFIEKMNEALDPDYKPARPTTTGPKPPVKKKARKRAIKETFK